MALVVNKLPANAGNIKTWVGSLGWEDPLWEVMATLSSILAWRIPMDRRVWWATAHGVTESGTTEVT